MRELGPPTLGWSSNTQFNLRRVSGDPYVSHLKRVPPSWFTDFSGRSYQRRHPDLIPARHALGPLMKFPILTRYNVLPVPPDGSEVPLRCHFSFVVQSSVSVFPPLYYHWPLPVTLCPCTTTVCLHD